MEVGLGFGSFQPVLIDPKKLNKGLYIYIYIIGFPLFVIIVRSKENGLTLSVRVYLSFDLLLSVFLC
jgi:hypothetical protein